MGKNITIRPAVEADTRAMVKVNVDTLKATYAHFYPPHLLAARTYEAVEASWRPRLWHSPTIEEYPFVAETEAGEIIGVLICGPIADPDYQAEIFTLFVLPDYHNQGIGKKLVQGAVTKLLERNLTSMVVWVLKDNPAQYFYEAIGGEQVREKVVERNNTKLIEIGHGWHRIETIPFTLS